MLREEALLGAIGDLGGRDFRGPLEDSMIIIEDSEESDKGEPQPSPPAVNPETVIGDDTSELEVVNCVKGSGPL